MLYNVISGVGAIVDEALSVFEIVTMGKCGEEAVKVVNN